MQLRKMFSGILTAAVSFTAVLCIGQNRSDNPVKSICGGGAGKNYGVGRFHNRRLFRDRRISQIFLSQYD